MNKLLRVSLLFFVFLVGCDSNGPPNSNAILSDIGLSSADLSPAFSPYVFNYTVTVAGAVNTTTVTVTTSNGDSTVAVNGVLVSSNAGSIGVALNVGANTITIVVTAPDTVTQRAYTIIVTRMQPVYSVAGTVTGLSGALTLQNNAGDDLVIAADGVFEFATAVADGDDYAVTVSTQPAGQMCSVVNGTGTIDAADVSDVAVTCVDLVVGLFVDDLVQGLDYTCSSGIAGTTTASGEYTCSLGDDVTFHLGAIVLGPVPATDSVMSPYNLFPDTLAALNLARLLQALDSDGLPDNGVIVINGALIALLPQDLNFFLAADEFEAAVLAALGISLPSLEEAQQRLDLTLAVYFPNNNAPIAEAGADQNVGLAVTVNLDGTGSTDADSDTLFYRWTFVSKPVGSTATLLSPLTATPSFVTDIGGSYVIGLIVYDGSVSGYDTVTVTAAAIVPAPTAPQGLQAVAGDASIALSWGAVTDATGYMVYWNTTGGVDNADASLDAGNATQIDHTGLTNGATYYYRVAASNASGYGPLSNEASGTPAVAQPTTFTVGGNVSGLSGTVTLQNNGADALAVSANSSFTFATAVNNGSTYAVTVSAQPAGQTCSVSNGSGTISGDNVSNVIVTCVNNSQATYSVGGTVSGLTGTVSLQNNGAEILEVAVSGSFTFATLAADSSNYAVTVSTHPVGQTCTVSNGTGTISGGDVTNVIVSCSSSGSGTNSDWNWASPLPQGNYIADMVWSGAQFVGVGDFGTIITSPSGEIWTVQNSGTTENLRGVVWQDGQFIAVGSNNTIISSQDGEVWTAQSTGDGTNRDLNDIVWGDGQFVAVGRNTSGMYEHASYTSVDGVNWTSRNVYTLQTPDLDLKSIAWNGSMYMAIRSNFYVYTSADAVTWTRNSRAYAGYNWTATSVTADTSQFVVVGDGYIQTTPDGVTWSAPYSKAVAPAEFLTSITWDGTKFLTAGSLYTDTTRLWKKTVGFTSFDGIDWAPQAIDSTPIPAQSRVNGGTQFSVASNGSQNVVAGTAGIIVTSADASTWTSQYSGLAERLNSIVWNGQQFVAVGGGTLGTVRTSLDGATWTTRVSRSPDVGALIDVIWTGSQLWTGSQFVAVTASGVIKTSNDAIDWTELGSCCAAKAIASNGSLFIAVGSGISSSVDGSTWINRVTPSGNSFEDVTWTGSIFVAVGSGVIWTSQNGIDWTSQVLPAELLNGVANLKALTWTGSQLVAVGEGYSYSSLILTSNDGTTWTIAFFDQRTSTLARLSGVTSTVNGIIAVGEYPNVLISLDGTTWEEQSLSSGLHSAIAVGNGRVVVVRSDGGILINDTL